MIFIQWKKFITCLACLTPYCRLSHYDESELSHLTKNIREYISQRILENKNNETIEDENISYFPLPRNYILNHINS